MSFGRGQSQWLCLNNLNRWLCVCTRSPIMISRWRSHEVAVMPRPVGGDRLLQAISLAAFLISVLEGAHSRFRGMSQTLCNDDQLLLFPQTNQRIQLVSSCWERRHLCRCNYKKRRQGCQRSQYVCISSSAGFRPFSDNAEDPLFKGLFHRIESLPRLMEAFDQGSVWPRIFSACFARWSRSF